MESNLILRHYLVAFSGLACGIASVLYGGFGVRFIDKMLHLIIYISISFECYYLQKLDWNSHKFRIIFMIGLVVIYSILINLWLSFFCFVQILFFLLLANKYNNLISPNIFIDSPLGFAIKTLPKWLIFLNTSYFIPLLLIN